jgi:hypothetical protein
MDTIAKLKSLVKVICRDEATVEEKAFVVASYEKAFKKSFQGCKCMICDAAILTIRQMERMKQLSFKLKKGIALTRFGVPEIYTSENITDEAAIAHLRARPQDARLFDYIPDSFKMGKYEQATAKSEAEAIQEALPEIVKISTDPKKEFKPRNKRKR